MATPPRAPNDSNLRGFSPVVIASPEVAALIAQALTGDQGGVGAAAPAAAVPHPRLGR